MENLIAFLSHFCMQDTWQRWKSLGSKSTSYLPMTSISFWFCQYPQFRPKSLHFTLTPPYYLALPCTLEALLGRLPKVQRGKAGVVFGHLSPKVDQPWPFNVAMVLHPFEPGLKFQPEMEPTNADAMRGDGKSKGQKMLEVSKRRCNARKVSFLSRSEMMKE